jgi:hypothetical protein
MITTKCIVPAARVNVGPKPRQAKPPVLTGERLAAYEGAKGLLIINRIAG